MESTAAAAGEIEDTEKNGRDMGWRRTVALDARMIAEVAEMG